MNSIPFIMLGGFKIHNLWMHESICVIEKMIESSQSHHCISLNISGMERCDKDSTLKSIIINADLILPDTSGVVLLSKLKGFPLKTRVPGVDLINKLCCIAPKEGYRIFILGDTIQTQMRFMQKMKNKYNLTIAGNYSPPFGSWINHNDLIISKINSVEPHILILATYWGHGERWLAENKNRLKMNFGIQTGGSLKILGGTQKRAPIQLQKLGMEGLYLVAHQPFRIKRDIIPMLKEMSIILRTKQ